MSPMQFDPESHPQVGNILPVETRSKIKPQKQRPPQYIVESLIAGLRVTETNLDFIAMSRDLNTQAKETDSQHKFGSQYFNPSMPALPTEAYLDGTEFEAWRTIDEFNEIVRCIGGVPVKIQLETEEPAMQGVITGLRGYQQGEWVYTFRNHQHKGGIELCGVSDRLHEWHSAAQPQLTEDLK